MKHLIASLLGLALLASCSGQTVAAPVNLSGTYDLALFPDLLFVTSQDRSELRVLDLNPDPDGLRTFVRAPNPLEPLSIPTVAHPTGMVKDVHYEDGVEIAGPYVYVHSATTASISIVGADRAVLRAIGLLLTPGPVTAMSARGPDAAGDPSRLYYATLDGPQTQLWEALIPPLGEGSLELPAITPRHVATVTGAIQALQVLPAPDNALAYSTRQLGSGGTKTFDAGLIDIASGARIRALQFPAPVRLLMTHASFGTTREGTRLYGILDESYCGGTFPCTGILAVDAASGQVSNDASGQPMLAIAFGNTLPLSMSLSQGSYLLVPGLETTASVQFELLGTVTTADGNIHFFDAGALRPIDADPNGPGASELSLVLPDGTATGLAATTGPQLDSVQVADGAARDEHVRFFQEAVIPGLNEVSAAGTTGDRFPLPAGAADRFEDGDHLVLTECGNLERVANRIPGEPGFIRAVDFPGECGGRTKFSVRASGLHPYVVAGDLSGYMGRTGPSQSFEFGGSYYAHPDGFSAGTPQLRLTMGPADPALVRNAFYDLTLVSSFASEFWVADPNFYNGGSNGPLLILPTAVVHRVGEAACFVAYPSANAIVEFSPPFIAPNSANQTLRYYR